MEVLEIPPEVRLVVLPCHAVDTGGGFAFERIERRPERIGVLFELIAQTPSGFPRPHIRLPIPANRFRTVLSCQVVDLANYSSVGS
jgi:hypothetical protein